MKAAVIRERGKNPVFGDFDAPSPQAGQDIVRVTASALAPLVKVRAAGTHYSATTALPAVAGVDGVGTLPDGRRVYFMLPTAPFGGLAEQTLVPTGDTVPVPDGVSDVLAAALANPGMSSWAALTGRGRFVRGERVLINGATGIAGRLAIGVAKHLGASFIAATGRDPETLASLPAEGADVVISLAQTPEELHDAFGQEFADGIDVVLDYLWGSSVESILAAAAEKTAEGRPMRFIQLGSVSGASISLSGSTLRSFGLVLMGSGLGSVPTAGLLAAVRGVLGAAAEGHLRVDVLPIPIAEVEAAWQRDPGKRRIVFTMPS